MEVRDWWDSFLAGFTFDGIHFLMGFTFDVIKLRRDSLKTGFNFGGIHL